MEVDLKQSLLTKLKHWHGYPALHFALESWSDGAWVVLYLDGRANKEGYRVQCYVKNVSEKYFEKINEHFKGYIKSWIEHKGIEIAYRYLIDGNKADVDNMKLKLKEVLEKTISFEQSIRPKLRS